MRFGEDSSVYVFKSIYGHLECCGCISGDKWEYRSTAEMVAHLREHIAAGHQVPDRVIPALERDDARNFPKLVEGGDTTP